MVRWKVRQLAEAKGMDTAYKLALAAGLPYNSVKAIWDNKAKRIDLDTLGKLGHALGAHLGDMFEEVAETEPGVLVPSLAVATY
jgi:DNA-binding Xre family transcriptional regulator